MIQYHDTQYLNLLSETLATGHSSDDRTGTGTTKVFGRMLRFDLSDGTIPLLTTKKMHLPAIIHEILWYLSGNGNIQYLLDNNVRIWKEWADENGDLGPVYGARWRHWPVYEVCPDVSFGDDPLYVKGELDQITNLIERLRTKPDDRRLLVTAWDPSVVPDDGKTFSENVANGKQALPPCHYTFQFITRLLTLEERVQLFENKWPEHRLWDYHVEQIATILDTHNIPKRSLSCIMHQRSVDEFLGLPFNIVQYSILTRMIAEVVGMSVGEFVWTGGDCHIYNNHIDQVREQLSRTPYPSPVLRFARSVDNIDNFKYDDFIIEDYQFHPTIKAKVSV